LLPDPFDIPQYSKSKWNEKNQQQNAD